MSDSTIAHLPSSASEWDLSASELRLSEPEWRPFTLTVSGGISLGSYESGVNWALLYLLKLANTSESWAGYPRPDRLGRYELVVATGASAGNINALLSATEWAQTDFTLRPPERTLFWNTWVDVGIGQLLPEFEASARGRGRPHGRPAREGSAAFTRSFFTGTLRPRIFRTMGLTEPDTLDASVDVAVGLSLTRVDPAEAQIERPGGESVGLRIHTQRAVTVYRLRSVLGPGGQYDHLIIGHHDASRTPRAGGVREPWWVPPENRRVIRDSCLSPVRLGQLVLPTFGDNETVEDARANVDLAFNMTLASSAFPVAFEPVWLNYVASRSPSGYAVGERRRAQFLDGGVFDNNPLGLALSLYEHVSSNHQACYDRPDSGPRFEMAWREPLFVYIDPDDRRSGEGGAQEGAVARRRPQPGLATLLRFASGIVPSARQHELEMLARTLEPYQRSGLTITNRFAPVVGNTLGAFGAFADPAFRRHDFYAGVYDGFYYVARQVMCASRDGDGDGCAQQAMNELRRWSGLHTLSPRADSVFRALYAHEFGSPPAFVRSVSDSLLVNHPLRLESDQATVLGALLAINERLRQEGREDDFVRLVRGFAMPEVRTIMARWGRECSQLRDSLQARGEDPRAAQCEAEPYARLLLANPGEWLLAFSEAVAEQLILVEDVGPQTLERVLEAAQLGLATPREQSRRAYRWSTSSVPRRRGVWERVAHYGLPSEFAMHFGTGEGRGASITYRPSVQIDCCFTFTFPLTPAILDYVSSRGDSLATTPSRSRAEVRFSGGPGLLVYPRRFVTAVEVRALYTGSFTEGFGQQYALGGEVAFYLRKVRLGYQFPSLFLHGGWEYEPPPINVSIGLTDVNGLFYWLTRIWG